MATLQCSFGKTIVLHNGDEIVFTFLDREAQSNFVRTIEQDTEYDFKDCKVIDSFWGYKSYSTASEAIEHLQVWLRP